MSIYIKQNSGIQSISKPLPKWTKLCELAGNGGTTKNCSVVDTSQFSELLLTCGTAIENQTNRILSSIIIPIAMWTSNTLDSSNGTFQAAYSGTTYQAGVSRISNTSVKLYANSRTIAVLYAR